MKILNRFNTRAPREPQDVAPLFEAAPDAGDLPIAGYERLSEREVLPSLPLLSQVDLAAIDGHERSHQARPVVLNKVHWLTGDEPTSGYDALDAAAVADVLTTADSEIVKAVREYERHHRNRHEVRDEIARLLPGASASAGEDRARDEKAARIAEGYASRGKTEVKN